MNSTNDKLIAVVRIRGRVGIRSTTAETLKRLRLKRINNCIIAEATKSYEGMIKKCNNYIAYGEIDEPTLKKLLKKNSIEIGLDKLADEGISKKLKEIMPFRLHPPRHGYKSIKRGVNQGGSLGYMGTGINELINRMV